MFLFFGGILFQPKKQNPPVWRFRPQKPQQNTPHTPKTTGSTSPGKQKNILPWFETQRIERRLDLWNAGRGTLVGPGMEAIMDPPRYGSSVAWLGLLGWKRPLGKTPPAKVGPPAKGAFLKGSFRIFQLLTINFQVIYSFFRGVACKKRWRLFDRFDMDVILFCMTGVHRFRAL